ncbi:MAG TPA: hypothetical protein VIM14_15110 [Polyangia bacterium]
MRSRTDRVRQAVEDEPRTKLQVRLTRGHGQVLGELRLIADRGGTDTRKVQGASCDDVVQALSLTAALALDPSALLSAPATAPAPATTPAPELTTSAPATTPRVDAEPNERAPANTPQVDDSTSSRAKDRGPKAEFGAGVGGTTLLAGNLSPSAALVARRILGGDGAFRPTLGIAIVYVRNDVLQSPKSVTASLVGLGGTVCPLRWTANIITIQPCALVTAGWLSASGHQLTHTNTANRLWLSAGGTLRAAALLGHSLSFELEAGFTAPLLKRRFYATVPSDVVAETPTISPMVGVGLTYGR